MPMEFEHPDDLGGDQLKVKGTYHFAILHTDENPVFKSGENKGKMRDGFATEFEVLAGPQSKKTINVFFRNGNLSHKDQGAFCRRVQGRALEAWGLVDPTQRGHKVTVELDHAVGRQFVATITGRTGDDGKEYLELDGDSIWHIDDPTAPQCERNQKALDPSIYPAKLRRKPESFGKVAASGNGSSGNGSTSNAGAKQTAPAATANLDDL